MSELYSVANDTWKKMFPQPSRFTLAINIDRESPMILYERKQNLLIEFQEESQEWATHLVKGRKIQDNSWMKAMIFLDDRFACQ